MSKPKTAADFRALARKAWEYAEACYRAGGGTLEIQSYQQTARKYEQLARNAPA